MELFCLGVSHRTAPVEMRERLALADAGREAFLRGLCADDVEVMLVSTCNRVELYVACAQVERAEARCREALGALAGRDVEAHLYRHQGEAAICHLFRVAASLDSMVVGEPQILGQVKDAFELAQRVGAVRGEVSRVCQAAFSSAKRVRSETGIGRAAVSMASAAVDLASKIFDGLSGKAVLVLGAGEMAELAARHLASAGAKELVVANRTVERAQALAAQVGGSARPLTDLPALLVWADVVICSTAAPRPILDRSNVAPAVKARRARPLLLVDLAVPRDVAPEVNDVDGVYAYDVDDLQKVVAENAATRAAEAAKAEHLIVAEVARFMQARTVRQQVPILAQLRARGEQIARAEVERTLPRLGSLDDKQRKSLEAMAMAIVNKLLHQPTAKLRAVGGEEDKDRLLDAAAELFGLAEAPGPSSTDASGAAPPAAQSGRGS